MRRFALVLLVALVTPNIRPAHADEPWAFVQITCVPELGYFAIRKFVIMNLPPKGPYRTEGLDPDPAVVAAVQKQYGIFDSDGLRAHPFTCTIPRLEPIPGWMDERTGFNVKVIGHFDKDSAETSYCMIADDAEVFVNGKSIGFIRLNPCSNGPPLLEGVEIAHDGVEVEITKCVDYDKSPKQYLACDDEPLVAP